MPSETTNTRGLSHSSFFHEEVRFADEEQVMAPKMDHMAGHYGSKACINVRTSSVASSALENNRVSMDSQAAKFYDRPENHLNNGRNVSSGNHFTADHDVTGVRTNSTTNSAASYLLNGTGMNLMGAQYENSLFSSSLSDLFIRKLKLPADNIVGYGQSVGARQYEEEMALESLKEIEAHTIGNLLPDEDDLFSGVTDGFDRRVHEEDAEDLDLFSSVGGLELGEDGSSMGGRSSSSGEHPFGQNPSRTLFVRNINSSIEDSELRTLFEQFGDISILYTTCKHRGFVMISYYDIRASCNAMKALQGKQLRRRKLDIHFSIPKDNSSENDINRGTIVVFNDSSVSNDELLKLFGVYGEIKEIRDAPHRNHHKFVEFYDVRSAEYALRALNRSDIGEKQTNVESGRPQEFHLLQQHSLPTNLATGFSGSRSFGGIASNFDNLTYLTNRGINSPLMDNMRVLPNGLSSLVRVESGNQYSLTEETSNLHPHSLPEYYDGLSNGTSSFDPLGNNVSSRPPEIIGNHQFHRANSFNEVFGNGSCPPPGGHYLWSNSHNPQPQNALMWPNSPSFINGMSPSHPQHLQRPPQHMLNVTPLPINNHHMGSAPAVNHLLDRRHSYAGELPDPSLFNHPGSLGNMRISGSSPHHLDFNTRNNVFPQSGGNSMDVLPIGSKTIGGGLHSHHQQRCSLVFPERNHGIHMMGGSFDSPNERTTRHHRRHEGSSSNQGENKKQFDLDLDRILRGDDKRTTIMIKNIPNKYTSKMLLSAIDDLHRGTYDFIYLPIDFKNKCNVGYAFINMTDPTQIIPFYKSINGRKWEKFNSEKVATLAYARIQGKAALIAHFQNSSLMNEDKRCRPILFHTDGPNAGDQVPFPMGSNIRHRPGKNRANTMENNQDYANRDSSSSDSGKESE